MSTVVTPPSRARRRTMTPLRWIGLGVLLYVVGQLVRLLLAGLAPTSDGVFAMVIIGGLLALAGLAAAVIGIVVGLVRFVRSRS